MFSRVLLISAFVVLCAAEVRVDVPTEEPQHGKPFIHLFNSFEKYPYYHGNQYDKVQDVYRPEYYQHHEIPYHYPYTHDYPQYMNIRKHPFFTHYFQKYFNQPAYYHQGYEGQYQNTQYHHGMNQYYPHQGMSQYYQDQGISQHYPYQGMHHEYPYKGMNQYHTGHGYQGPYGQQYWGAVHGYPYQHHYPYNVPVEV